MKNFIYSLEQRINDFKIDRAKIGAEIENFETEMLEFPNVEITGGNKENLVSKLQKTQEILSRIGSVNMKSLEVYDSIREEYDKIKEKVKIISKEKESILKIIHDIDVRKRKLLLIL